MPPTSTPRSAERYAGIDHRCAQGDSTRSRRANKPSSAIWLFGAYCHREAARLIAAADGIAETDAAILLLNELYPASGVSRSVLIRPMTTRALLLSMRPWQI